MLKWPVWEFCNDLCASLAHQWGMVKSTQKKKCFLLFRASLQYVLMLIKEILTFVTLKNVWKLLHFISIKWTSTWLALFSIIKPYITDTCINISLKKPVFIQYSDFRILISKEILPKFRLPVSVSSFMPRNTLSTKIASVCRGSAGTVYKSYPWIGSIGHKKIMKPWGWRMCWHLKVSMHRSPETATDTEVSHEQLFSDFLASYIVEEALQVLHFLVNKVFAIIRSISRRSDWLHEIVWIFLQLSLAKLF